MDGLAPRDVHAAFAVALTGRSAACLVGGPGVHGVAVLTASLGPVGVVWSPVR